LQRGVGQEVWIRGDHFRIDANHVLLGRIADKL
jgi:hypothetical protein